MGGDSGSMIDMCALHKETSESFRCQLSPDKPNRQLLFSKLKSPACLIKDVEIDLAIVESFNWKAWPLAQDV
jgi:hypothetical protein